MEKELSFVVKICRNDIISTINPCTGKVCRPDNVQSNDNVTLHFKLEKMSLTGLVYMDGLGYLADDKTNAYTNFTPPGHTSRDYDIFFLQRVSSEVVEQQNLDLMPGFRFSWWYTGAEVTPDPIYKHDEISKYFVR